MEKEYVISLSPLGYTIGFFDDDSNLVAVTPITNTVFLKEHGCKDLTVKR